MVFIFRLFCHRTKFFCGTSFQFIFSIRVDCRKRPYDGRAEFTAGAVKILVPKMSLFTHSEIPYSAHRLRPCVIVTNTNAATVCASATRSQPSQQNKYLQLVHKRSVKRHTRLADC